MPIIPGALRRAFQNAGPPISGSTAGTQRTGAEPGDMLWDTTNGVAYINEGAAANPYWTPAGFDQHALFGVHSDFRDNVGVAVGGSAASVILAGSGVRVFGDGHAENDSGAVAQSAGEGGMGLMRLTTTNEAAHIIALGMPAGVMQPDQHGTLVVDVVLTNVTNILTRAVFIGFVGAAIDAFVAPVTIATTTATLVQDDVSGLMMDSRATDADALWGVHNKSNAAATQDLTADGDTGPTNMAAAATEQRFRTEIASNGNMTCFVNKTQVYTKAISLDVDEECSPVVYIESTDAAVKTADVRQIAMWATR